MQVAVPLRGALYGRVACRVRKKGAWWWLTGDGGEGGHSEGRGLSWQVPGGCGWSSVCLPGVVTGKRCPKRGWGWRRFGMSLRVALGQLARGSVGKWDFWCCTGQVSWSAHGRNCGGEVWRKP